MLRELALSFGECSFGLCQWAVTRGDLWFLEPAIPEPRIKKVAGGVNGFADVPLGHLHHGYMQLPVIPCKTWLA